MRFFKTLLILFLSSLLVKGDPNDVITDGLSLPVSQKAIDMIIYYEAGGKEYYNKFLTRPEVPAWQSTSSGVTIGIGFDASYNSKEQIQKALEGIVPQDQIDLIKSCSGIHGRSAYYNALPKVKYKVIITYEQAEQIFKKDSLVRFTKQTADAFTLTPNRLHPHSNGALVSLVFNRGPSLSMSDSRKEMRWIKYNISVNREDRVPSDIKSMKRLWGPNLKGLWLRRDAESELFKLGVETKGNNP